MQTFSQSNSFHIHLSPYKFFSFANLRQYTLFLHTSKLFSYKNIYPTKFFSETTNDVFSRFMGTFNPSFVYTVCKKITSNAPETSLISIKYQVLPWYWIDTQFQLESRYEQVSKMQLKKNWQCRIQISHSWLPTFQLVKIKTLKTPRYVRFKVP